jgi:hypothetical protein
VFMDVLHGDRILAAVPIAHPMALPQVRRRACDG